MKLTIDIAKGLAVFLMALFIVPYGQFTDKMKNTK